MDNFRKFSTTGKFSVLGVAAATFCFGVVEMGIAAANADKYDTPDTLSAYGCLGGIFSMGSAALFSVFAFMGYDPSLIVVRMVSVMTSLTLWFLGGVLVTLGTFDNHNDLNGLLKAELGIAILCAILNLALFWVFRFACHQDYERVDDNVDESTSNSWKILSTVIYGVTWIIVLIAMALVAAYYDKPDSEYKEDFQGVFISFHIPLDEVVVGITLTGLLLAMLVWLPVSIILTFLIDNTGLTGASRAAVFASSSTFGHFCQWFVAGGMWYYSELIQFKSDTHLDISISGLWNAGFAFLFFSCMALWTSVAAAVA